MNTIDKLFKSTFQINTDARVIETNGVYKIKNVFKDINAILDFESKLTKWDSCEDSKPGINTLKLPFWTSYYVCNQLMKIKDFNVDFMDRPIPNWETNGVIFNYFYYNNKGWYRDNYSLSSNNCILPHTDSTFDFTSYVVLFNLNQKNVKTCFWSFDGIQVVENEDEDDCIYEYCESIDEYNLERKLSEGRLKKEFNVEYGFNDAIVYSANSLHSAVIDEHWTIDNPRCLMRIVIPGSDFIDYTRQQYL